MEHNAENLIQEKIRMSEQGPVTWKSEWVWSRVELPAKRKSKMFWYAAAAVVVGFTSIGFYWTSVKYNMDLMVKIELLESQLTNAQLAVIPKEVVIENCVDEEPVISPVFGKQKRNELVATIVPSVADVPDSNNTVLIEVGEVEAVAIISDEQPEINVIEKQPEIKPIIGRVSATSNYVTHANRKELKLMILKPESQQVRSDNNPKEYKILSARIN